MTYIIDPMIDNILITQILIFIFLNSVLISVYLKFNKKTHQSKKNFEPWVSVIIPTYNKASILRKTIESVLSLNYSKKEVIVVNDGSEDGTREICNEYAKKRKIKFIDLLHGGKANALNSAIRAAKHDIILTVDADSIPDKNSLRKLVGHFHDEKIGAVTGTLRAFPRKSIISIFQFLEYMHMNFQRACQSFLNAILVCPGALTAYRKQALEKVGMFSGDTLVDDFDMTITLQKNGYKVVYEKTAEVLTFVPDTLKNLWKQRVRWARGGIHILLKHFDVLFNPKTKALGYFSFPIHVTWLFIPILPFITIIVYTIPNIITSLQNLFSKLLEVPNIILKIPIIYQIFDQFLVDFLALNNLNFVLVAGYISITIFLGIVFLSFKIIKESFKPMHLKTLSLIFIYWIFMIFVYLYAVMLELTKRKRIW